MDSDTKELLITQFRAYLDEMHSEAAIDVDDEAGSTTESVGNERQTDLYSLFVELAALKNEVKLESRQVKAVLDEFKSVLTLFQSGHEQLKISLERSEVAQQELRRALLRPVLLDLLEIYDRLEAGSEVLSAHRPGAPGWLHRRSTALITAVGQGQSISLRRLQTLLQAQQVEALQTEGQVLDPHTMRAVATGVQTGLSEGIVIEELRKGFRWDGQLLRPAEVKVNKIENPPQ